MTRISIRCSDRQSRVQWRHLCNQIDDEAEYEEIVNGLVKYFEENESEVSTVRRIVTGPEFR